MNSDTGHLDQCPARDKHHIKVEALIISDMKQSPKHNHKSKMQNSKAQLLPLVRDMCVHVCLVMN